MAAQHNVSHLTDSVRLAKVNSNITTVEVGIQLVIGSGLRH